MPTEEPDRSRSHAGRFHSTRWENVLAARDPADPQAGAALAELCRTYWYPLYAFARRKGCTPEQAEDLTQGFFSDGLARGFLRTVDPARGRFRTFLLAAFENYLGQSSAPGRSGSSGAVGSRSSRSTAGERRPATSASRPTSRRPSGCTTAAGPLPCSTAPSTGSSGGWPDRARGRSSTGSSRRCSGPKTPSATPRWGRSWG